MVKELLSGISRHCFRIFYRIKNKGRLFNSGGIDILFFGLLIALLATGIIMMFSASYVNAWYDAGSALTGGDPYFYFKRQTFFAVVGLCVMYIFSRIHTDAYEDMAILALFIAVIILIYVLINPVIIPGKEKFHRWIKIPVIGTYQPSEFAKIAIIMYLSWSFAKRRREAERNWVYAVPHLFVIAVLCGLVFMENHVSGTVIVFLIGIFMLLVGGTPGKVFAVGIVAFIVGILLIKNTSIFQDYVVARFNVWWKLFTNQELTYEEQQGDAWQTIQSLYAIGSGGMFGLGFGNSRQKHLFLPEPQNDFVFAIVCEELGYVGAIIIMVLFVLLVLRGFHIACHAETRFGALLVMGICFQIGLEAGLNIAVTSSLAPNTGISLPFFSYGGSALLTLLAEMGVVLSVSRTAYKKKSGVPEKVQERDG